MKNQIVTIEDFETGKFAAQLYSYEYKNGSLIPTLLNKTEATYETSEEAAQSMFKNLEPEIKSNTEVYK